MALVVRRGVMQTDSNQTTDRKDLGPPSPLGWPAALVALLLLSTATYIIWWAFSKPPLGGCGMLRAAAMVCAGVLVVAALSVICLDMVIRLMD